MTLARPRSSSASASAPGRERGPGEAAGVAQRRLLLVVPPGAPAAGQLAAGRVGVDHLGGGHHRVGRGLAGHRDAVLDLGAHDPPHAHAVPIRARIDAAAHSDASSRSRPRNRLRRARQVRSAESAGQSVRDPGRYAQARVLPVSDAHDRVGCTVPAARHDGVTARRPDDVAQQPGDSSSGHRRRRGATAGRDASLAAMVRSDACRLPEAAPSAAVRHGQRQRGRRRRDRCRSVLTRLTSCRADAATAETRRTARGRRPARAS